MIRAVQRTGIIHPLTQVILSILGFAQLNLQRFQAVVAALEEADTLHVWHAIALLVVDAVREVYLVRQKGGLSRRK